MPNYLQAMAGRLGSGMGIDPRRRMAQKLMEQGMDTSPAHLGTGIGRLGKALAAAYMMRQSQGQEADAMEWLTAKDPRTRQPTREEAYVASPALANLYGASVAQPPLPTSGFDLLHELPSTEEAEVRHPTDGLEKDFFEGGGLKETTNWEGGLRHGENIEYNEDGSVKKTVVWDRGKEISRTGDKGKSPPDTDLQFDKDFPPEVSSDPEPEEVPQETSFPYGRRDYAQELASGMTAYQGAKANQISDPRTRMEWLRESYRNNPELKNNWFANRLIQNMMFNEIARGDEDRIWKREQEAKIKAAERPMTPKQYEQAVGVKEAGRDAPTSQMKNFEKAKNDPAFATYLDTYKKAGGRISAAIQNYEHLQTLLKIADPAERKTAVDNWWNTLGTAKHVDTGPEIQVMTRGAPTIPAAKIKKGLTPSQEPGHVRDVERNKYIGKQMGEAQLNYPDLVIDTEYRVELLDKALNHPGLPGVVGLPSVAGITHAPGTSEANFRVLMKQIEGANFLQAFQGLKGGGHITEIEGEQAKQSLARMSASQDETEFKVALLELQALLRRGLMKAGIRSRGGITPGGDVPSVNNRRKGDDPMDLGL